MLPSIGEDLIGADDEVAHRAAEKHLAWSGVAADARTDVNGQAADVVIRRQLAFAGVPPGARTSRLSLPTLSRMAMALLIRATRSSRKQAF
jgi:hypothetical protein